MSRDGRKTRSARPVLAAAGGFSLALLLASVAVGGTAVGGVLAGTGWLLVMFAALFAVFGPGFGWKVSESYPELGHRKGLWVRAGATPDQLRTLNEIHRLNRLNPPIGYADRRTLINPLADAYAIFSSPAWKDPWLADRQLLIDPIAEAGEIIGYVHRVTEMVREVRAKKLTVGFGSATWAQYESYERALVQSLDVALRRARALTLYRYEVNKLERLLDEQRAWPEAVALGDRVMDVLSESVRHDFATNHLEESGAQLRLVEHGLRDITAILTDSSLDLRALPDR